MKIKDKFGKTPIDAARESKSKPIEDWENEEAYQKRIERFTNVLELLKSYERNPNETRFKLRKKLEIMGKSSFSFFFLLLF